MASEWYVQQGGKQYGPLSSANLKKLAADGKITPTTSVRLGDNGSWVAASRVQGLFAIASPSAASPSAAPPTAAPRPARSSDLLPPGGRQAASVAAPPVAPPQPPPMGRVIAPVTLAPPAALPRAVPADTGSMTATILGAVAVIFGTLALATCWLPVMGGAIGWLGIVVGALGTLVGISGLVVAARSKGSGLMLNVSGTSSSLVGLVMAIVAGVMFGLFTSAPAPKPIVVAQSPPPPPPKQETPPPKQPEPEPEPVWTDASEAIQQGDIRARVVSVGIEQIRLESMDLATMKKEKPKPMLKIKVALENTSTDKIVQTPGWNGGSDLIGAGVGELLGGELAKAAKAVAATTTLADNIGNAYKQVPTMQIFGAPLTISQDNALRPGGTVESQLVFPPPLPSIETLRLELSAGGFSGTDSLRFQIPKAMITGL